VELAWLRRAGAGRQQVRESGRLVNGIGGVTLLNWLILVGSRVGTFHSQSDACEPGMRHN
jgi:hypothetical protein